MAPQEPIRKTTHGPGITREIPDKLYFRIGEVAKLCEVPAYVLRFWEGEFPQLKPNKGGTGQRLYRRRDVEMALRIKTLLYDEGYTITGARQAFKAELRTGKEGLPGTAPTPETFDIKHLLALQSELQELHAMLSKPAVARQSVQPIRSPRPIPVPSPAPTPFRKPQLLQPARLTRKQETDDSFISSLFDDPPPLG